MYICSAKVIVEILLISRAKAHSVQFEGEGGVMPPVFILSPLHYDNILRISFLNISLYSSLCI